MTYELLVGDVQAAIFAYMLINVLPNACTLQRITLTHHALHLLTEAHLRDMQTCYEAANSCLCFTFSPTHTALLSYSSQIQSLHHDVFHRLFLLSYLNLENSKHHLETKGL